MRAVFDPNVIISALLSPRGAPARLLLVWQQGEFELIVSPALLAELERALAYPKLRKRINSTESRSVMEWLAGSAISAADPDHPPSVRSADPGDDYLIALAQNERAVLVSGDKHLLELIESIPIFSPMRFLNLLGTQPGER